MRRSLVALVLLLLVADAASARGRATALRTSRWWTLTCDDPARDAADACLFVLRLRGPIDWSRQRLVEEGLRRRDAARRELGRDIALRVDVDSPGGKVYAAMEIGRLLRSQRAQIFVDRGASCTSACVFVLMGAVDRRVAPGSWIGIHRPSLEVAGRDGSDALVDEIGWYADQMGVSRRIVDDMMAVPSDRMRFLTPANLEQYGMRVSVVRDPPRASP